MQNLGTGQETTVWTWQNRLNSQYVYSVLSYSSYTLNIYIERDWIRDREWFLKWKKKRRSLCYADVSALLAENANDLQVQIKMHSEKNGINLKYKDQTKDNRYNNQK